MFETILLIAVLILGLTLGYFIGKLKLRKTSNSSNEYDFTSQISEMKGEIKGVFSEMEKTREKLEDKRDAKLQDISNTIDSCILVVPPSVIDMVPELIGIGKDSNVFICSYKDVFPIAHILEEQYLRFNEDGDIGEYKKIVKQLNVILEKILSRTETLDRAIKQISNANDNLFPFEIKDEVSKGKRL